MRGVGLGTLWHRAHVVLYEEAEDMRSVPRRLHELNAAARAAGSNLHGAKTEEGSEPDPGDDRWTGFVPRSSPPTIELR
jgi:hypothetical protein